jgi:NAD(P)-dependent dehydrogenase (short-subunit alcohol dehydrogenase family)
VAEAVDPESSALAGTRLSGRTALIVGGGTTGDYPGTGSAIARLFSAQGASVVVMGRSAQHTERTVSDVRSEGGIAVSAVGDTTRAADCRSAVDAAVGRFGRLDVVVNNVAVHKGVSVDEFEDQVWDEIFDGNLKAPMLMASAALPALRDAGGGSIVNIGSVAGLQSSGQIGYGTAKAALLPLTRDMAMALGKDHVRVNCVIPGHLHTPHVARVAGGNERRDLRNRLNMLGIEGTGWDAAWAALFFACDESRFITGQSLTVDGGVTSVLAFTQVMRSGYVDPEEPAG